MDSGISSKMVDLADLRGLLQLDSLNRIALVGIAFLVFVLPTFLIGRVFYNLYFHPLAKFPGPKFAAMSDLWYAKTALSGKQVKAYVELHEKYGPVVRVAPNELSFSNPDAWKDIYGHHPRAQTFTKGRFYNRAPNRRENIVSIKDHEHHAAVRRLLSHAFSAKALHEQEGLIDSYIDTFITRVGKRYVNKERGPEGEYLNLVSWFNYTTFDIIGDLAFGDSESFGCLKNERAHNWVKVLLSSVKVGTSRGVFQRFTGMLTLGMFMTPKAAINTFLTVFEYSEQTVKKRLERETDRKDFFSYILDKKDVHDMPEAEMVANAEVLVVAGSETTATALSGIFFFLLKRLETYEELKAEIRGSFSEYSQISALAVARLPYLNAVIEEGLRMYPPVPVGLPRVSPGGTVAGHFIPRGTEVSVHQFATTHSKDNWAEPNKFLPERWIDPKYKETDRKEASQPFSVGPRVCIGRNLAYLELRLILAKFIFMYDVEAIDKEMDWFEANKTYTLWWKPELNVKLTARKGLTEFDRARFSNN